MKLQTRFPLWTKIAFLAALNIGLLALALFVFVRIQLSNEFESFLLDAAREKVQGISAQLALDIQQSDPSQWDAVLEDYSQDYGVTFLLYGPNLTQLAGPEIELPREVEGRFRGAGRGGAPSTGGANGTGGQRGQRGGRRQPPSPFLVNSESDIPYWVGMGFELQTPSQPNPIPALLLLASDSLLMNPFFLNWQLWLGVLGTVLILSALCWFPLVRGLTHSIAEMTEATAEIAEGRFEVALKTRRQDELGHLATSINRMASRLETFTRGQKRFLGDVAHELRSPLGRMQLALGILERKTAPEAQQNVADLKEDVDLMANLTDGLLQVAKAGARPDAVALDSVNISTVAQTALRREIPAGVEVQTSIDPSLNARANTDYLLTALSNVLRNAVRYAAHAGPIRIRAEAEADTIRIAVHDSGPGVPEEALDKIFTPFYRLDASRTSRTGGAGLGLAIVRNSIEACGGAVVARNHRDGGLEVVMSLFKA